MLRKCPHCQQKTIATAQLTATESNQCPACHATFYLANGFVFVMIGIALGLIALGWGLAEWLSGHWVSDLVGWCGVGLALIYKLFGFQIDAMFAPLLKHTPKDKHAPQDKQAPPQD